MSDLDFSTALSLIERTLRDAIVVAYGKRLTGACADIVALRARVTRGAGQSYALTDGALLFVVSKGVCYKWSTFSLAADDGDLIVKPTDAGTAGRWLKTTSTSQTGYLRNVILHNGDFDDEILEERIFAQSPCVAVHFNGEEHVPLSQVPGALYDYRARFQLWSVSRNYRQGDEAAVGSQVAAEASADPGAMQIHGDLKNLLAGNDLGIEGVKYIEIQGGGVERANLADRVFIFYLDLEVRATVSPPSDAGSEVSEILIDVRVAEDQPIADTYPDQAVSILYEHIYQPGTDGRLGVAQAGEDLAFGMPVYVAAGKLYHLDGSLASCRAYAGICDGNYLATTWACYAKPGMRLLGFSGLTGDELWADAVGGMVGWDDLDPGTTDYTRSVALVVGDDAIQVEEGIVSQVTPSI